MQSKKEETVQSLKECVSRLKDEIKALKCDKASLKKQLAAQEKNVTRLLRVANTLEATISSLRGQKARIAGELLDEIEYSDELQRKIDKLEAANG